MKPFEGIFGNNCELRMIEYLLPLDGIEFNLTELAEEVGVSRPSATKAVKKFVEWGLINARSEKNLTYYSINTESPIIKNILQLNNLLIEKMLGEEALYEIHDYLKSKKSLVEATSATISMERESKQSDCVNINLNNIPKPRIWWQETSAPNPQKVPISNQFRSIYLSGATT
jgi:DNA-binding transcriptional ArsR family regulator